jgi:hypothetical protein
MQSGVLRAVVCSTGESVILKWGCCVPIWHWSLTFHGEAKQAIIYDCWQPHPQLGISRLETCGRDRVANFG